MDKQMVQVLSSIHFAERYEALCNQYSYNFRKRFVNYDNNHVLDIFREIVYQVKFHKRENFFQSVRKVGVYQFKYNISIKSGGVELIWYVMKNNKYYTGDIFSDLEYDLLNLKHRRSLPIFRNYEDLRGILTIAFRMYEDMTAAFLRVYREVSQEDESSVISP